MSELIHITGRAETVGGLPISRLLPALQRRAVGPFVFVDHIGPATLVPGQGLDVPPHPHIGLATVTYLFEGIQLHRDTLGNEVTIVPGDVNLMSAGRGIAHSERTPADARNGGNLHGVQTWLALPRELEQSSPHFEHYDSAVLPRFGEDGVSVHLLIGQMFGHISPVAVPSSTLYAVIDLAEGAELVIPADYAESAVLLISGAATAAGETLGANELVLLAADSATPLRASDASRILLLGGAPLDGPRTLWWNFVASDRELIEAAKVAWQEDRFGSIPNETERLPLPIKRASVD
ncbi:MULTISPECIES: pirin family protein [Silvimonas]|uniref:pirin family protein n=1 Tax=Silvimonas TaxID=300264 RepID=UPI0024B3B223|nr:MULTISPECIES: pirin family protein [Silvimonas]MDR3427321.1 pirin family protein [Silvimonas sp.]